MPLDQTGFDRLAAAIRELGATACRSSEGRAIEAEIKADGSPVSEVDRFIEKALRETIQRIQPDVPIVGEEYGGKTNQDRFWAIDPLDGTRAYLNGLDTWSILVALIEYDVPTAAVAYLPARDVLFACKRDKGVYRNGAPFKLKREIGLKSGLVCLAGLEQFHNRPDLLNALSQNVFTTRAFGDFANYAALLEGKADAVVDPNVQIWDIAPAWLFVEEAGGFFSNELGDRSMDLSIAFAGTKTAHTELMQLSRSLKT